MLETLKELYNNALAGPAMEAVIGLLLVGFFAYLLKRTISAQIENVDVRYRARKFVSFLSYLVGALVVLAAFSTRLGGLSVAFGVAGAGVAFALQEVIASIAGWIAISAGGFYSPGDRVKLGTITGDVIDVSILRTTLMEVNDWVAGDLYNGRMVRITNSVVWKQPVINYSGEFPFLWDEITLAVHHASDIAKTRALLEATAKNHVTAYANEVRDSWTRIVRKYRIEAANVAPLITVELTPNFIQFTLRYVVDYRQRRSTKDRLFSQILDEIAKSEGAVQMPSTTMEITSTAPKSFPGAGS